MKRPLSSPFYNNALLYEAAFSYRDIPSELDVIQAWYRSHAKRSLQSSIEFAAGPAEHSRELARRGIAAAALDCSKPMCVLARLRAEEEHLKLAVHCADMRKWPSKKRFDLALTMLDSVCHLSSIDAMLAHLDCVASHLHIGGLYVMECGLPPDCSGSLSASHHCLTKTEWQATRGTLSVHAEWGSTADRFDPSTQVCETNVMIRAETGPLSVSDRFHLHHWNALELDACVRLERRLEIVAWYGDFHSTAPFFANPSAWRMIVLLRRRSKTR